eukprot:CAMPEP_0194292132 /NCGR_PEP_ID=MMETSP0169-20130528/44984_1 /TAXON_ID=218684 /ORGANISM="Corethron pennatum, Strain L29A3" /LENGTH=274 /DNA_ID=CAMNT_0039040215 /DNA_START=748 /DNA_END=1572 /DNA_ORIENTATION=-
MIRRSEDGNVRPASVATEDSQQDGRAAAAATKAGGTETAGTTDEELSSEMVFFTDFHAVFAVVAASVLGHQYLSTVPPYPSGYSWLVLVLLFSGFFGALSRGRGSNVLHEMWLLCTILSMFMVFPDWVLCKFDLLTFPEDGVYQIGHEVSCYMAFMWTIPLLWCVVAAYHCSSTHSGKIVAASFTALFVFTACESVFPQLFNIWGPTEKVQLQYHHISLFVLPAEALLGGATQFALNRTKGASIPEKVLASVFVSLFYTGCLGVSYLLIEIPNR